LIKKEFESENQIKTIQYIELDKLYKNIQIQDKEIKKTYEANKDLFEQEFKKINYTELLPNNLIGQVEYNKAYFKEIDDIENNTLDGTSMNDFVKRYNLSVTTINETNLLKKNREGKDIIKIDNNLFSKIFNLTSVSNPELITIGSKYYLGEVAEVKKVKGTLADKKIKDAIISQLKIKYIIDSNTNIVKEMSEGKFKKKQFNKFGKDNNLEVKEIILRDLKNEIIFASDIIREIFKVNDGELQLITNSMLTKNYIIVSKKTEKLPFNKSIKDYKKYKSKAKMNLANKIYSTFDKTVNDKYNIEINQKVLSRIKNTL
jgi:hypothetical protein